jgi:pimeloyl-ACP methyl ester carboxylesterase
MQCVASAWFLLFARHGHAAGNTFPIHVSKPFSVVGADAARGPINTKNFDEKIKVVAWKSRPAWYLSASQDRMIDPDAQTAMAERMKAKLASVSASHVPMLSRPKDVAAVILSAAAAIRSK